MGRRKADDPTQWVSHETIYRVPMRCPGELRKAVPAATPGVGAWPPRRAQEQTSAALLAFTRALRPLPPEVRKTLTYDQGKEMARQEDLARRLRLKAYFAGPHGPMAAPSNENANGLIRRHLPKGMELSTISQPN